MDKQHRPDGPEIRVIATGLEIREAKTDSGTVRTLSGYVVRYDQDSKVMQDWSGDEFVETIAAGAFDQALREANTIKALWSHDTSRVLGSTANNTLRLTSDAAGLRFECDLPDTTAGNDAYTSIKRGDVDGVSFGMKVRKDKWSAEKREGKPPLFRRAVLDADLREISPVAFPAYPSSDVSARSLDAFKSELQAAELEHRKRMLTLELELIG